jgi:azurin
MSQIRMIRHAHAILPLLAFGCGGADKPAAPAEQALAAAPTAPVAAPAPTPAPVAPVVAKPDADGIVRLTGTDQMRYSATRIEVPAGQKVKIEFKNAGVLPKEVMGHNLNVLKAGSDTVAFATKAMTAKATDYLPQDALDQVVAHTKLLGPGESETIEFDLPAAGTYPYLCTFPGHVGLMNGQLIAQ